MSEKAVSYFAAPGIGFALPGRGRGDFPAGHFEKRDLFIYLRASVHPRS